MEAEGQEFTVALREIRDNKQAIDTMAATIKWSSFSRYYSYINIIAASPTKLPASQYILKLTPTQIKAEADKLLDGADKKLALDLAKKYDEHLDKVKAELLDFVRTLKAADVSQIILRWKLLLTNGYLSYVSPEQLQRDIERIGSGRLLLELQSTDLYTKNGNNGERLISQVLDELKKAIPQYGQEGDEDWKLKTAARFKYCSLDIDRSQHLSFVSHFWKDSTSYEKAAAVPIAIGITTSFSAIPTVLFLAGVFGPAALAAAAPIIGAISVAGAVLALITLMLLLAFGREVNHGENYQKYIDNQFVNPQPAAGM